MKPVSPPVYIIEPPYDTFVAIRRIHRRLKLELLPGAILALRVLPMSPTTEVVESAVDLLRNCASVPVILWSDLLPRRRAVMLAARLGTIGVYAHASGPIPDATELRTFLTDADAFGVQLPQWISRRGHRLTADAGQLLQRMVALAARYATIGEVQRMLGPHANVWRRVFKQAGLGHPSDWYSVIRLLLDLLLLQRDRDRSVEAVALAAGYYDAAAFRHRCRELVGHPPGEIRNRLGWEWMLYAACRHYGLLPT